MIKKNFPVKEYETSLRSLKAGFQRFTDNVRAQEMPGTAYESLGGKLNKVDRDSFKMSLLQSGSGNQAQNIGKSLQKDFYSSLAKKFDLAASKQQVNQENLELFMPPMRDTRLTKKVAKPEDVFKPSIRKAENKGQPGKADYISEDSEQLVSRALRNE